MQKNIYLCQIKFIPIINKLNLLFFMKKAFFYLFSLFCFIALSLVSCEKPETGNNEGGDNNDSTIIPEGTILLQALNSEYSTGADMNYSEAVSHSFLLMFATEECEVIKGTPYGSGDIVVLDLCSETADNFLPAEGVYPIVDDISDGNIIAGFDFDGTPIGSYVRKMKDDDVIGFDCIVNGAVEIKKTSKEGEMEFFIYAIFEDGKEVNYYYKGELLIEEITAGM